MAALGVHAVAGHVVVFKAWNFRLQASCTFQTSEQEQERSHLVVE